MSKIIYLSLILFLSSCGGNSLKKIHLEGEGVKTVVIHSPVSHDGLKDQAKALGLDIQGESFLKITGDVALLNQITLSGAEDFISDDVISVRDLSKKHENIGTYLAKNDFGFSKFQESYPQADGRGVIVGVFDDGISPHQEGYKFTTTGQRKILKKGSISSLHHYLLNEDGVNFKGVVDENKLTFDKKVDLNKDSIFSEIDVRVSLGKICLDLNLNKEFTENECKSSFSTSGDYYLVADGLYSLTAEFSELTKTLSISQPELVDDSHGEGVASVMSAYFENKPYLNGVAPGTQMVDFDISEITNKSSEANYTIGNILVGLEWLAKNGAEVINVSYSLFFQSVKTQTFMANAIDALIKKYNVVICFSAGNNGPGLGSLNRKAIYPDSVLVAGAYVSKELDEKVWGVSGLPDEGRVVYYSSRGPGPLGDGGPILISPLSSLTYSDPQSGFRAFNGTSSASPALSGAASLLISALKQEGILIDATTIVHALRLSGKRLKNEPFVSQGYGLPQLKDALIWYKKLISGSQFYEIESFSNKNSSDGIGGKGLVLFTSHGQEVESVRLDLLGKISKLAPLASRTELVVPLLIKYTDGITGSKELWASVSKSRLHIDINLKDVLKNNNEGFGEISFYDQRDGSLLLKVPVTVIDDLDVTKFSRSYLSVGPQEGARLHLNAKSGVQLYKVRTRVIEGETNGLVLSTYDSHRIRQQQMALNDEIIIKVDRPGHQQIGLAMVGGAGRKAVVEVEILPIEIKVLSLVGDSKKPQVLLRHKGSSQLTGQFELKRKDLILDRKMVFGTETSSLSLTLRISEVGIYEADLLNSVSSDFSYPYKNCQYEVLNQKGERTLSSKAVYEHKDSQGFVDVTFTCTPFDQGISKEGSPSFGMKVYKLGQVQTTNIVNFSTLSEKNLDFKELAPGNYELWFSSIFNNQKIKVSEIEFY